MNQEKEDLSRILYIFFLTILTSFVLISLLKGSQWIIDNFLSILVLSLFFIKRDYFELSFIEFLAICTTLFFHNIGMFGLYGMSWNYFAYDNFIHFISSMLGAIVIFNMINIKTNGTLFKKEKLLLAFMIIGIVTLIGVGIEMAEFTGGLFYGEGEGLFFTGEGDIDNIVFMNKEIYDDTLVDLVVNLIGAIIGTLIIFNKKKGKKINF